MMTPVQLPNSTKARELRQAFDAIFAAPPPPPPPPTVALLLVRAGGDLFAVKRAELTGFVRGDAIVQAPGRSPGFLGLAGLRGGLYPIWSLAVLLGRPAAPVGAPSWLLLAEAPGTGPCAFACEAFEKMIFAPEAAVVGTGRRDAAPGLTSVVVPWGSALAPLVDLPALQADIWKRKEATLPRRTTP